MALAKSFNEIGDTISLAVYCNLEPGIMVLCEDNEHHFLQLKVGQEPSYLDTLAKETKEIFGDAIVPCRLLAMLRLWTPGHPRCEYVNHIVLGALCTLEQKRKSKKISAKYRHLITWPTDKDLKVIQDQVAFPLLPYAYAAMRDNRIPELDLRPADMCSAGPFAEVLERVIVVSADRGNNIYDQIIQSAGFSASVQLSIYKEYLTNSYPSIFLSFNGFLRIVRQLGWQKDDVVFLFRSADVNNRKGLTFREFLYMLAALEPGTNHSGGAAEVRSRYIFRYFDRDGDGKINHSELRNLVQIMRRNKNQPTDNVSIDRELDSVCRLVGFTVDKCMTMNEFLVAVSELKIRGMSQVMRNSKSIKSVLQPIQQMSKLDNSRGMPIDTTNQLKRPAATQMANRSNAGDYEIALHTVKMQKSGNMINLDQLFKLQNAVSGTTLMQANINERTRRVSLDAYGQGSVANDLMRTLRTLLNLNNVKSGNRGNKKDNYTWGTINPAIFYQGMMTVCGLVKQIMSTEKRMLELRSPCYIMGDLHGNYGDLMYLEKMFWPLSPGMCPATLLFLGDYVDRGNYSLEVITYLFCYKTMFPNKIKMIRGNHEIREIQKMFTFYSECVCKFGERMGSEIWNAINEVFDVLPIAAIIDGKIFCVHGGIPPPWLCPSASAINTIVSPMPQPDEQSSLAWEMMWNDPIKDKDITDELRGELLANDGFAKNVKRGTAHVFSTQALERFLNTNGLSHIVRAHEVALAGFNIQMKGKLLTVFSSSRYGSSMNDGACILADCGRLRLLRLDTTN